MSLQASLLLKQRKILSIKNAQEVFIARTRIAAAGITPRLIESLAGNASDTTSRAYGLLKQQLTAIKQYLQRLRYATESMDRLVLGLLKLSRVSKQGLNIDKVNLSALAQDVIQELDKQYKNKIYQTKVTENLFCHGDARLLRTVLENLIANAYKYSSLKKQPLIEFGATEIEGQTAYYVKDNGVGFDMVHRDKLFEPFQRLHNVDQFEGSGIGLSTVARIIRRHMGRIWADGKPNQGAVFYFTLGLII